MLLKHNRLFFKFKQGKGGAKGKMSGKPNEEDTPPVIEEDGSIADTDSAEKVDEAQEGTSGIQLQNDESGTAKKRAGKGKGGKAKKAKRTDDDDSSSESESSDAESDSDSDGIGMLEPPNEIITSFVDKKTVRKIVRGKLVDLNKLYPKDAAKPGPGKVFSIEGNKIMCKEAESRITGFAKWLDCFLVFMTIRGKQHPKEMLGMLKHIDIVKRLGYDGYDGVAYDLRFRSLKASFGGIPWGSFRAELLSAAPKQMYGKNNSPGAGSSSYNKPYCRFFNTNRCFKKDTCKFKHACFKCHSDQHGSATCNKK